LDRQWEFLSPCSLEFVQISNSGTSLELQQAPVFGGAFAFHEAIRKEMLELRQQRLTIRNQYA